MNHSPVDSLIGRYLTDDSSPLPNRVLIDLYSCFLPRPLAMVFVAWMRMREFFGVKEKPFYGERFDEEIHFCQPSDLPTKAPGQWAGRVEELSDLDFKLQFYYHGDYVGTKQGATALFANRDETTFAVVEWISIQGIERLTVTLNSFMIGGTEIHTSVVEETVMVFSDFMTPDYVDAQYYPLSTKLKDAWETHRERIQIAPVINLSADQIQETLLSQRRRLVGDMTSKGFLRTLTDQELERLDSMN